MAIFKRFLSAVLSRVFSSEEVWEIERVLIEHRVEERRRIKFLDGFNLGLNIGKKIDELGIPRDSIFKNGQVNTESINVQVGKFSHADNFYNFGMALGYIIAILRYHPQDILSKTNTERFIAILRQIKKEKTKAIYYDFLRERILKWHDDLKIIGIITTKDKDPATGQEISPTEQEANFWAIMGAA